MSRASQKGSIITFVVVGVLLSTAVLGGLYVVSERNFFGLGDATAEVAQETEGEAENVDGEKGEAPDGTGSDDVVVDTDEPAQANEEPAQVDDQSATDEAAGETSIDQPESATEAETANVNDEATGAGSADEMVVAGVDTDESTETTVISGTEALPATGPSDAIVAMVGIGSLVAAVLAWRRSTQL